MCVCVIIQPQHHTSSSSSQQLADRRSSRRHTTPVTTAAATHRANADVTMTSSSSSMTLDRAPGRVAASSPLMAANQHVTGSFRELRSTLPVVRSPNKSMERPLGLLICPPSSSFSSYSVCSTFGSACSIVTFHSFKLR